MLNSSVCWMPLVLTLFVLQLLGYGMLVQWQPASLSSASGFLSAATCAQQVTSALGFTTAMHCCQLGSCHDAVGSAFLQQLCLHRQHMAVAGAGCWC